MDGFRKFVLGGGLVPTAVAFVMGTAFATVVNALVKIIMELIAKAGGADIGPTGWRPGGISVGDFITAFITFLIIAAVVYFAIVKPYTAAKERFFPDPDPGETEVDLLKQIRDSLSVR